jgi:DNA repair exonuclease SbcCD nuclease subunit
VRPLRVLLLADTHLGLDLPERPRVERRRRGSDFFDNFRRALAPALAREVDLVVHGGDLLFRSRVRRQLVLDAFEPLKRVADAGVPVVLVPGNHERSAIPYPLLGAHPGIHVLDRPRAARLRIDGIEVAACGFPCVRNGVAGDFSNLLEETGHRDRPADVKLLCLHQTVEGARVGPSGYTFRRGDDVIPGSLVPAGFAAVLAGHIHRWQVLERDLGGQPLAAPVLYPGSIERTSFAERNEEKGFLTLQVEPGDNGGHLSSWRFHQLPARPMVQLLLEPTSLRDRSVEEWLKERLERLPADAVVSLRFAAEPGTAEAWPSAAELRTWAPSTMTLEVRRPTRRG